MEDEDILIDGIDGAEEDASDTEPTDAELEAEEDMWGHVIDEE